MTIGLGHYLGLAALLSHFGLPEGMGSILLIALVIFAGFVLVRMFMARRQQPGTPLQYAVAGANATPAASSQTVPTWRIPSTAELAGGDVAAPAQDAPEFGVTRKALPQGFGSRKVNVSGFTTRDNVALALSPLASVTVRVTE